MRRRTPAVFCLLLALTALVGAVPQDWRQDRMALQESLSSLHPRLRGQWLADRGLDNSYYTTFRKPENTRLAEVGRWPWGPSWELCGRDSLLFLGSGSGVRILSITDSVHPRMLGQIVARGLVSQVAVRDSLLFVACGGWGAQVYSVSGPANPRELGSMDAVIGDLAVVDTFCYTLGGDSLKVYSISDPSRPVRIGAVRDSGDLVVVANGHAFCAGRWLMNIYNVTDPAHPTWANSRGGPCYAMHLRGNLLFCTAVQPDYFAIIDVTDPTSLRQVGGINGYGGDGVFADDRYAYLSCNYEHNGFFVIDIADSSRPALRDSINPEGSTHWDNYVPRPSSCGYHASDYGGLVTVDLHDANAISEAWSGYKAGSSVDISLDGVLVHIANDLSGLQIVDANDPTRPVSLGIYDVVGAKRTFTAVARDSFSFAGRTSPYGRESFLALDVSDPANPELVAQESCLSWPQDMFLRDSLVYIAATGRFAVVNVARPREPRLVGSCADEDYTWDLDVEGNVAAVAHIISLRLIDVAQPANPQVVGAWPGDVSGVDIIDTIAYVTAPYTGFVALSIANPTSPYVLDSLHLTDTLWWNDVVVVDSLAFVGGERIWVVDVSNPRDLRLVPRAAWTPPYLVRRLEYSAPYLYAACYDAGVCVLDCTQVAVGEGPGSMRQRTSAPALRPNPTDGVVSLCPGQRCERIVVRDVLGRTVLEKGSCGAAARIDLTGLKPGLYFVELRDGTSRRIEKLVKR